MLNGLEFVSYLIEARRLTYLSNVTRPNDCTFLVSEIELGKSNHHGLLSKPRPGERASEKKPAVVGRPGFRQPWRSWRAERGRARAVAAAVRAAQREAPRRGARPGAVRGTSHLPNSARRPDRRYLLPS